MRLRSLLVGITLGTAAAGCGTFWKNTALNLTEAPIYGIDQCRVSRRNHCLAEQAWDEVRRTRAGYAYSPDYADGFVVGYADYLEGGGNGQPPAVPPYRYRLSRYQTPEGCRAIEDWYEGFREGAAASRASGLREVIVLPLSAPPINALVRNPDAPAGPVTPSLVPGGPVPDLPAPRRVESSGPAGLEQQPPEPPG